MLLTNGIIYMILGGKFSWSDSNKGSNCAKPVGFVVSDETALCQCFQNECLAKCKFVQIMSQYFEEILGDWFL